MIFSRENYKLDQTTVIRPSRTETFEHTTNGLLKKRAELFNEAERIRDRLAEIKNDIGAIDRTLTVLGFEGDLDAMMPRQKREVIFGRGELTRAILNELRTAREPLSSRDIARELIALRGEDARDRNYLSGLTKRVSKALGVLYQDDTVKRLADPKGNYRWVGKLKEAFNQSPSIEIAV